MENYECSMQIFFFVKRKMYRKISIQVSYSQTFAKAIGNMALLKVSDKLFIL